MMRRPPLLSPLLAALVAACGGARDEAAEAARLREALAQAQAGLPPAAAPPAPAPEPATVPSRYGEAPQATAQMIGQDDERVRLWLGEPMLKRAEGNAAEIWLYAAEGCALDVVLYREPAGGLRVGFAAARATGEGGRQATEAECLGRIAEGPAPRPELLPTPRPAT